MSCAHTHKGQNVTEELSSVGKRFFYRVFCGFFLGLSVFAPGFSGSVVAIIMGVYQDIVRIASNPFRLFKQNVLFVLPLGIGAAASAVLFVVSFQYLFEAYEKATYLLFIGLIAGNLPVIAAEIKKRGFRKGYLFGGCGAFASALVLGITAVGAGQPPGAAGLTDGLPYLALCGLSAGAAALIPGMSVSMVLIILGVYGQLIFAADSLLRMRFAYLVPLGLFGACAMIGLVLASTGIRMIFERFPGFAHTVILGFMAGSLAGILIQSLRLVDPHFNWLLGGAMLVAGLAVSMLFVALGKKMNTEGALELAQAEAGKDEPD
jgi:putative membrane protein